MKIAFLSVGLLAAVATVHADQEKIEIKDLPKAVQSTLTTKYPNGTLIKATKEEEKGRAIYEVTVEVEKKKLEVVLSAKGKLLEVEQAIDAGHLPKAVASAIKDRYPKAQIKKIEQVTKFEEDEEEKFFEVVLSSKDKLNLEVKISPVGKILEEEKDDEDDKPGQK